MLATALAATVAPPAHEVSVSERGRAALYRDAGLAEARAPLAKRHPLAQAASQQLREQRALLEEDACGGLDGKATDIIVVNPGDHTILLKTNTEKDAKMQLKNVAGNWIVKCPCRATETTIGRKQICKDVETGACPGQKKTAMPRTRLNELSWTVDQTGFCKATQGFLQGLPAGLEGSKVFALSKILPDSKFPSVKETSAFFQEAETSKAIEKKGEYKHVGEDGTFMTTVFLYTLEQEKDASVFQNINKGVQQKAMKWYSCAEATDKNKNEHAGEVIFSGACPGSAAFLVTVVAFVLV